MLGKIIAGVCTVAVVGTGVAAAVPESREWILNKVAPYSEVYKEQKIELDESKKTAAEYLEKYNASQAELATTKTALETTNAELTLTKTELATEKEKVETINTQIDNATVLVNDMSASLDEYCLELPEVSNIVDETTENTSIAKFNTAIMNAGEKIKLVKDNVEYLNSTIESKNAQIIELEQNAETSAEEIAKLQAEVSTLTTERDNAQIALTNAQSQVTILTARVSELESQLATANARITELENRVETLTQEKQALQTELANTEVELSQALLKLAEYQKTITLSLTNCSTDFNEEMVYLNEGFELTLIANEGMVLPETITVTNADYTYDKTTGLLTITNVSGDVEIEAIAEINLLALVAGTYENEKHKFEFNSDGSGTYTYKLTGFNHPYKWSINDDVITFNALGFEQMGPTMSTTTATILENDELHFVVIVTDESLGEIGSVHYETTMAKG